MRTPVCISFSFRSVPWQIVRHVMMDGGTTTLMIIIGVEFPQLSSRLIVHMTTAKMIMGQGEREGSMQILHDICYI